MEMNAVPSFTQTRKIRTKTKTKKTHRGFYPKTLRTTRRIRASRKQSKLIRKLKQIENKYLHAKRVGDELTEIVYLILATELRTDFFKLYPVEASSDIRYLRKLRHAIESLDSDDELLDSFVDTYTYTMNRVDRDVILDTIKGFIAENAKNSTNANINALVSEIGKVKISEFKKHIEEEDDLGEELEKMIQGLTLDSKHGTNTPL